MAEAQNTTRITGARMRPWQNAGPPSSGTAGTLATRAEPGGHLWDTTNGVMYVNEGTQLSPYWTPVTIDQRALFGVWSDFRDRAGKAIADTAAAAFIPGSGVRIFGQGVAETDSGAVVQAAGEGGHGLIRLTTTNEAAHTIAMGMAAGVMQPDQHQLLVVDVIYTMVTDILTRALFVGFAGLAADALDPIVTGATTTATLVQDDLAGVLMDSRLTDAAGLFGVHNKSNAAATLDLTTGSLDTGVDVPAAATEQRIRVEIAGDGDMTVFADKVQIFSQAIALDIVEECSPVVCLEATSTTIVNMDVRQFAAWATR